MNTSKTRVAILISGRGSNMMSLVEAAKNADYPADISAIISNRPDAGGLEYAQVNDIDTKVVDHKHYASREEFDRALDAELGNHDIELICLAGFMRLLTPWFVEKWAGKILNIHPSLLPLFKGLHPHRQALDAGVRIHGCTIHIVTPEMDAGPIVAQAAVPVLHNDTAMTLEERVLKVEHQLYPAALALMASGKLKMVDQRLALTEGVQEITSLPLMSPRVEI
jgi:phosphoribosylglycinamide formyltransferase-1